MVLRSSRRRRRRGQDEEEEDNDHLVENGGQQQQQQEQQQQQQQEQQDDDDDWRVRNRRVAEKFAATSHMMVRPSVKSKGGQVSSTPTGFVVPSETKGEEEWCGPFSVARQLLEKREEAKAAKEREQQSAEKEVEEHPLDQIMNELSHQQQIQQHPSLTWKPTFTTTADDNLYVKRKRRNVNKPIPSLYERCIHFIVQHIQHVESLGPFIPDSIRKSLANAILDFYGASKLTFPMLQLLFADCDALELLDVTQLAPHQLSPLITPSIQTLKLQHAGRCIDATSISTITSTCHNLTTLSITGAYMLQDRHAAQLTTSLTTLTSITFHACPLLAHQTCQALANHPNLMELSLHDIPFTPDHLQSLLTLTSTNTLLYPQLQRLSFSQIHSMDDDFVSKLLPQIKLPLQSLELMNLPSLTDATLEAIRSSSQHFPSLQCFKLVNLPYVTNLGLETFLTPNIHGLPNPSNQLRTLHLSQLAQDVVNDTILELAATMSSMKPTTTTTTPLSSSSNNNNNKTHYKNNVVPRELSTMGGLVELHLQQSAITDRTLELLVETCTGSLEQLDVSFCCYITNAGLGYFVDQIGSQLKSITIWGCAQITEDFLDGHSRFGNLHIIGAWMKQQPQQPQQSSSHPSNPPGYYTHSIFNP